MKRFKPKTPTARFLAIESRDDVKKGRPLKSLTRGKCRTGGRNNLGRTTAFHRGGGHKKLYRIIDFKRKKDDVPAKVAAIEYDPNRSAYIALLHYADGEKRYILAPEKLAEGDEVLSGNATKFKPGCCMPLAKMPLGSVVHNVELTPGSGGQLVRSAGSSAQYIANADGKATLRMPSGEVRLIPENCRATFGVVSNAEHSHRNEGKAGRKRWQGRRPVTRGTAMNPVDHPHGGGEGRQNSYIPQTPWAKPTKGYKTVRGKRAKKPFIVKRRSKK